MNEVNMTGRQSYAASESDDINPAELLRVLKKSKKALIAVPFGTAILGGVLSFALPNMYKATTTLLPPQQAQSGAAALLSQLGGVASLAAGATGLKSPNDLYVGMLKSRTVADALIAKFDLKKRYATESQEQARKKLEENTNISSGKDGLITIEVEDQNKQSVPELANAYVGELLRLTRDLAVTEASQRRVFFERQLERAKDNLTTAEITLKAALDKKGVISVDTESRALLEMIARIKAQVSAKEIQLNAMKAFLTPTNPEYQRAEQELVSLRNQLSKFENGPSGGEIADGVSDKPSGGFENIKLLRDVKYYQMLYELLAKQYEVARLDEAKDPSLIQVLDRAVEPERKSKPKRAVIVALAAVFGLFGTLGWTLMRDALIKRRTRNKTDISGNFVG